MIQQITKFVGIVSDNAIKIQRQLYKEKSEEIMMFYERMKNSRQAAMFRKQPGLWCVAACMIGKWK